MVELRIRCHPEFAVLASQDRRLRSRKGPVDRNAGAQFCGDTCKYSRKTLFLFPTENLPNHIHKHHEQHKDT